MPGLASTYGVSKDKLNLQLEIRTTDWNRFQEKIRKGSQQLYILGWNADYPDPDNFLYFLLNSNAQNIYPLGYHNPALDRLTS